MIILLNASIIGACAVSLSTSYAFGDVFKVNHSLHRKLNEAKFFYSSYAALVQRIRKGPDPEVAALARMDRETWQMPPLAELTRPKWSVTRKVGMFTLRAYLFVAVILLVVKVIQLALGHLRGTTDVTGGSACHLSLPARCSGCERWPGVHVVPDGATRRREARTRCQRKS